VKLKGSNFSIHLKIGSMKNAMFSVKKHWYFISIIICRAQAQRIVSEKIEVKTLPTTSGTTLLSEQPADLN